MRVPVVTGRARLVGAVRSASLDERGAAIITVIAMITVALALGGVATVTATNAMRGSVRDEDSKDALAAAEAGLQIAIQRQNQVAVGDAEPCVDLDQLDRKSPAGTGGWCEPTSGTVGDASYTYRVTPPSNDDPLRSEIEIVSTGTADGVTRRTHVIAESPAATAIFGQSTVIGKNSISLGSNAIITGNAATNGSITLHSNAELCGTAQYGEGGSLSPAGSNGGPLCAQSTYPSGPGTVALPPIDQGDVATVNSNDRITSGQDTISGSGSVNWDSANRTLTLDSGVALTLGGQDYSFCRLHLKSNTELIVAAGRNVRIFFDAPENCQPALGGGPQVFVDSNSKLSTTSGSPASLQLLVVGSPTSTADKVELNSNSTTTMPVIVYAPNSAILMDSNSTILGAIAGESVMMNSNAKVIGHADSSGLQLPVPLHYLETQFVECTSTPAPANAPSSNC